MNTCACMKIISMHMHIHYVCTTAQKPIFSVTTYMYMKLNLLLFWAIVCGVIVMNIRLKDVSVLLCCGLIQGSTK